MEQTLGQEGGNPVKVYFDRAKKQACYHAENALLQGTYNSEELAKTILKQPKNGQKPSAKQPQTI